MIEEDKLDDYHMHEALHMASFLMAAVYEELCDHSAIKANAKWEQLAEKAHLALAELYQEIGKVHLG